MATPLKNIPPCPPPDETPCTPAADIPVGEQLLVTDPSTKCDRLLENKQNALVWSDGSDIYQRTGDEGDEIILTELKKIEGSWQNMINMNGAGELGRLEAPAGCKPQFIRGQDGEWTIQDVLTDKCFPQKDICECLPLQVAGWVAQNDCNGDATYCLVRFDVEQIGITIPTTTLVSTDCIQVTGVGSPGDPWKMDPKISPDAGNVLECRVNGLYAPCCNIYGVDPLL